MRKVQRTAVVVGLATLAVAVAGAPPAQAAGPKAGRYAGRTSQKLPISLWAAQAKKGELGRFVDYTGIEHDQKTREREIAALKVRIACKGSGGSKWKEVIPVQILGPKRNHTFGDSGDLTVRHGRFGFAPFDLGGRGHEALDERLKGRFKGRKAAGTVRISVTEMATIPFDNGDVTFAKCKSGTVKWSARLKKGGKHGIPKLAPGRESKPRRARADSYFTRLLDGTEFGGGGLIAYQPQGGPAFIAYFFNPGGQLLYCRRAADGSRDYRSGTWSVTVGYLWARPHNEPGRAEGELRLNVPGAVAVSAALDGRSISVSPSGGGLLAAGGDLQIVNSSVHECQSFESEAP
jgi:hypothetical protein